MKTYSILNDVLGPVMAGPSSSHTAAPAKIGLAVWQLWGKPIAAANVIYDAHGSYPGTHVGQGSDFGFAGGLLGMRTDEENFRDSLSIARSKGVDITFTIAALDARHPNEARIDVLGDDGRKALSVLSFSTGGGTFLLPEMDGFPIQFDGQRCKAYLCCAANRADAVEEGLKSLQAVYVRRERTADALTATDVLPADASLFEVECASLDAQGMEALLAMRPDCLYIRMAQPSSIAVSLEMDNTLATAAEALALAEREPRLSMADIAVRYELQRLDASESEAREKMREVMRVMRRSLIPPPKDDPVKNRLAPMMAERLAAVGQFAVPMGALDVCMAAAVAVMENSCAHRTVVAAPTAGSSGIIPACIVAMGQAMQKSDGDILDALWACGLVGAFIANQATFGAEVAGCQAEVGAAACMAAAGIVQLTGGSVQTGFHAACIAMQSLLGLICDPVGGLTEIPCIERNATAAAVAVTSANLAMAGMKSLIPLDETIQTMLEVGRQLPDALRCTCRGGLCVTASGQKLACSLTE